MFLLNFCNKKKGVRGVSYWIMRNVVKNVHMAPIAQISLLGVFLVNEHHKAKAKGIKNLMDYYNFFFALLYG